MTAPESGWLLALLALYFALLAIESAVKPFIDAPGIAFVLLGARTDGLLEAVATRIHALSMLSVAIGVFRLRRFALILLGAYPESRRSRSIAVVANSRDLADTGLTDSDPFPRAA